MLPPESKHLTSLRRTFALPPSLVPHAAQFIDPTVEAISFHRNPGYDPEQEISYSLSVDHEVHVPDAPDIALIRVELSVDWSWPDGDREIAPPFDLTIVMTGSFQWPEPRDLDLRRAWTEYNGVYLIWPYLRVHVAEIVMSSGLPTFTLPTFVVPRVEQWAEETGPSTAPRGSDAPAG